MIKKLLISILFLGIIPCEPAVFTLFKSPESGKRIVLMLNMVTCGLAGIYFIQTSMKKIPYEKIRVKYLLYFIFLIFMNILAAMISSEDYSLVSRTMSLMCLWAYYSLGIYAFNDARSLVKTINITLLILIAISTVLYYVDYESVSYIENAATRYFKGVAKNRNSFSEITLFYVASNLYLWRESKRHSIFYIITTAVAVYTTFLTHSATSAVSVLLMIILAIAYAATKKTISFKLFLSVYAVVFISLIIMQSVNIPFMSEIMGYFQKDSSLTGRTDIWKTALNLISEHPMFGRGYDTTVLLRNGIIENDPHNSILYMLLTQGICGSLIFICMFYRTLIEAGRVLKNDTLYSHMYIFIIVWMIRGLTESAFTYTHFVFWISIIVIEMLILEKKKEMVNGEDNEKEIHRHTF